MTTPLTWEIRSCRRYRAGATSTRAVASSLGLLPELPNGLWLPLPTLYSIAENIKKYASLGVTGIYTQGCNVSTGGDLTPIKNYVFSRLMVDPSLDVEQLVD